ARFEPCASEDVDVIELELRIIRVAAAHPRRRHPEHRVFGIEIEPLLPSLLIEQPGFAIKEIGNFRLELGVKHWPAPAPAPSCRASGDKRRGSRPRDPSCRC